MGVHGKLGTPPCGLIGLSPCSPDCGQVTMQALLANETDFTRQARNPVENNSFLRENHR